MKTFTYPQQKWVMTAALLAVLGFNVSFNSHQGGIASADFASTSGDLVESKLVTAQGVMPVKYINNGESEVLAVVPKKMTEGKVCDTCGYETIPLSTKNKNDIDALNVQLLKTMQGREGAADTPAENVPEKKNPFDTIRKSCKRVSDKIEALTCHKDRYIALLKNDKIAKDILPDEALQFYKTEIQSRLVNQLSDARRISARARRATTSMTSWNSFQDSEDAMINTDEVIQKSLYVIEDLIREVPARFESVRHHLIVAETDILRFEASQIKQAQAQAAASKGTPEGLYLSQEALAKLNELHSLNSVMGNRTVIALREATDGQVITQDLNAQYNKFLQDFNNSLNAALAGNGTLTNGSITYPSADMSHRLANPGRNSVQIRTGTSLAAPLYNGTQTILVPVQVPTQNNGVSFGTMIPASPEALRMRAEIRQ